MGVGGQRLAPAALFLEMRLSTHFTGGWVGPGAGWTGVENLCPTGIRSSDRPASRKSLYRLHYPSPSSLEV
jgi:hypothetical protein